MIKYSLRCDNAHDFESWFSDSASYDMQRKRGFVSCPACNSTTVEKQIMAPRVFTSEQREAAAPVLPAPGTAPNPAPTQPMAMLSDEAKQMREMIRAFKAHVEANTHDVGRNFAEEARKIHYGETDGRPIRGQASFAEAKELHEEGIGVVPLPHLPDDLN
jgi:hypothetical protein